MHLGVTQQCVRHTQPTQEPFLPICSLIFILFQSPSDPQRFSQTLSFFNFLIIVIIVIIMLWLLLLWLLFQSFCSDGPATKSQPKPIDDNKETKKQRNPCQKLNLINDNKFVRKLPHKTKTSVHKRPKRRQKEKFF